MSIQKCFQIIDKKVCLCFERLMPFTQRAIVEISTAMEFSGSHGGIQVGPDEYVEIEVEVYFEKMGHVATDVCCVTAITQYKK